MQRTMLSSSSTPEIMITGMCRRPSFSLIRESVSYPSSSGISMSRSTTSNGAASARSSRSSAWRPLSAVSASCPSDWSPLVRIDRARGSSSTTRIRPRSLATGALQRYVDPRGRIGELKVHGSIPLADADRLPAGGRLEAYGGRDRLRIAFWRHCVDPHLQLPCAARRKLERGPSNGVETIEAALRAADLALRTVLGDADRCVRRAAAHRHRQHPGAGSLAADLDHRLGPEAPAPPGEPDDDEHQPGGDGREHAFARALPDDEPLHEDRREEDERDAGDRGRSGQDADNALGHILAASPACRQQQHREDPAEEGEGEGPYEPERCRERGAARGDEPLDQDEREDRRKHAQP